MHRASVSCARRVAQAPRHQPLLMLLCGGLATKLAKTLEILTFTSPTSAMRCDSRATSFRNEDSFLTREHNWADNHTFSAARIHRPASVAEVRKIVTGAWRIRAIGARHSFNGIADSPGELIDLGGIDPDFVIDRERGTVTVGAGTTYSVLAAHLQREGLALHNMASLPHVTVAGATATGTHGSGDRLGNLSTAMAGLEIVTATGDVETIRRGDSDFDAMIVSLGAFDPCPHRRRPGGGQGARAELGPPLQAHPAPAQRGALPPRPRQLSPCDYVRFWRWGLIFAFYSR